MKSQGIVGRLRHIDHPNLALTLLHASGISLWTQSTKRQVIQTKFLDSLHGLIDDATKQLAPSTNCRKKRKRKLTLGRVREMLQNRFFAHSPHRKWLVCPRVRDRWLRRGENRDGWTSWSPNPFLARSDKLAVTPSLWSPRAWHSGLRIWIWLAPPICCTTREAGKVRDSPCFPHRDPSDWRADTWRRRSMRISDGQVKDVMKILPFKFVIGARWECGGF